MKANFIIQEDKKELVSQGWDQKHRLSARSLDEGECISNGGLQQPRWEVVNGVRVVKEVGRDLVDQSQLHPRGNTYWLINYRMP